MHKITIFWFRRDLRLEDNAGLYHALRSGKAVLSIFIFDTNILDKLENKADRRVEFILNAINDLNSQLQKLGSLLKVLHGSPDNVFKKLITEYDIETVFTNHDYEPYAKERDEAISAFLASKNISLKTFKDQCIFERNEVVKDDGKPYTVFTPYSKKWKQKLNEFYVKDYPCQTYFKNFYQTKTFTIPSLSELGFEKTDLETPAAKADLDIIKHYKESRDFPAIRGTSRLSVHLRFGTVSIRSLVKIALQYNDTWLNELIWRDFYMMILDHFPHAAKNSFKPQYNRIIWRNNEEEFKAWREGKTGFAIVDAGMRELNATGFMHNRVRMITASFLIKDLLIDWRWGEAYFAEKLLDFDLSANNGGWQWAASSGCDAAPYFRIFNPMEQTKKFDPNYEYIKKWVPEFNTANYVQPIIDHAMARNRTLAAYKEALSNENQMKLF